MNNAVTLLLIEDDEVDAEFVKRLLTNPAPQDSSERVYGVVRASNLAESLHGLKSGSIDIVLLDLNLPDSEMWETFEVILKAAGEIPIVIWTGVAEQNLAREMVKRGAQDYLVKQDANRYWLRRSLDYALERKRPEVEYRQWMKNIHAIHGILTVCAWCGKIENEKGIYVDMATYIKMHTSARFSHSMCPSCSTQAIGEMDRRLK